MAVFRSYLKFFMCDMLSKTLFMDILYTIKDIKILNEAECNRQVTGGEHVRRNKKYVN